MLATENRVRVFWQPGCTSCLRTKEFLTKHGVDYESINVHGNAAGMEELRKLGARSVPIVARGDRFVFAQTLTDVIQFLDLKIKQLNTDMLQYSSFYNREYRLGPDIAATQKELEDARKESELANKKIIDLEDELRKSGGPAGWAR